MRVAIVGGGSIGLCTAAAARHAGAEVAVVARHDVQRDAADRLGCSRLDGEYALVVDAAGTTSALERAVELCRPGGTLLLVASYWEGLTLPGFAVALKELRIIPASMYSRAGPLRDFDAAAALLAARPEIADILITHRYPLDAAAEAFATAAARSSGAIKVVLEP
jgi:threonine dehydrogenase-like Zn-dependent dehydrogenase